MRSAEKPQQGQGPREKNFHFQVENVIGKQYRDNPSLKFGIIQRLSM